MANISIQRTHQLSRQELKEKIDQIMIEIEDKIEFKSEWESEHEFVFRRKGAKGRIEIDDSKFELNLNLGIMFRALKSQIESRIIKVVDQQLFSSIRIEK